MNDGAKPWTKIFEDLCRRYTYRSTPDTKDELIAFWSAGIEAGNESPNDIEALDVLVTGCRRTRGSRLYTEYPALEELNDDLLYFEDMHHLSDDVDTSIREWYAFMKSLINRTKGVIE